MRNKVEGHLDDLDLAILNELQTEGRISNAELARRINLSPPATHARLRQLEDHGYIQGYAALLDRERLGYDMLCIVHIGMESHTYKGIELIQDSLKQIPEVLECFHTTGEFDYILKVALRDRSDLEHFLANQLTQVPNIARIQTSIVIRKVKSTTALPLFH